MAVFKKIRFGNDWTGVGKIHQFQPENIQSGVTDYYREAAYPVRIIAFLQIHIVVRKSCKYEDFM